MDFRSALAHAQQTFHEEARTFFGEYQQDVQEIDIWSQEILAYLEEYCLRPGKALRPLLVALGAAMAQNISLEEALSQTKVRSLMLVVELTHKRLLMADDVADKDELRNEKPAFHILLAQELSKRETYAQLDPAKLEHVCRSYTEIAGVWLQTLSFAVLEKAPFTPQEREQIVKTLLRSVYERTPAGWYILMDQGLEKLGEETSVDRFLKGLRLVTGEYTFVAPLRLGYILGGDLKEKEAAIAEFGANAGLLFQLTDDRIGLFGDPQVSGKPVGNDLREGKKTLYVQYAYQRSEGKDRETLVALLGAPEVSAQQLDWVQQLVRSTGAFEAVEQDIKNVHQKARASLEHFLPSECRTILEEMLFSLEKRDK